VSSRFELLLSIPSPTSPTATSALRAAGSLYPSTRS